MLCYITILPESIEVTFYMSQAIPVRARSRTRGDKYRNNRTEKPRQKQIVSGIDGYCNPHGNGS